MLGKRKSLQDSLNSKHNNNNNNDNKFAFQLMMSQVRVGQDLVSSKQSVLRSNTAFDNLICNAYMMPGKSFRTYPYCVQCKANS